VSPSQQDRLCGITLLIRSQPPTSRLSWRKSDTYTRSDVCHRPLVRGTVSSSVKTRTAILRHVQAAADERRYIDDAAVASQTEWPADGCDLGTRNPLAHLVIKPKPFQNIVQRFQHSRSRHNTRPLPADARAGVIKVWAVRWQDVLLVLHSGTACSPFTVRSFTCIKTGPTMRDGRPPVACICTSRRPWTALNFYLNFPILEWLLCIVLLLVCMNMICTPCTNFYTLHYP